MPESPRSLVPMLLGCLLVAACGDEVSTRRTARVPLEVVSFDPVVSAIAR